MLLGRMQDHVELFADTRDQRADRSADHAAAPRPLRQQRSDVLPDQRREVRAQPVGGQPGLDIARARNDA